MATSEAQVSRAQTLNRAAVDPVMSQLRHGRHLRSEGGCRRVAGVRSGGVGRRGPGGGEANSGDCDATKDLATGGGGHGAVEISSVCHVNSLTYQ